MRRVGHSARCRFTGEPINGGRSPTDPRGGPLLVPTPKQNRRSGHRWPAQFCARKLRDRSSGVKSCRDPCGPTGAAAGVDPPSRGGSRPRLTRARPTGRHNAALGQCGRPFGLVSRYVETSQSVARQALRRVAATLPNVYYVRQRLDDSRGWGSVAWAVELASRRPCCPPHVSWRRFQNSTALCRSAIASGSLQPVPYTSGNESSSANHTTSPARFVELLVRMLILVTSVRAAGPSEA